MKSIFSSKTILLGLLVTLIPFLQALQALPLNQSEASVVSGVLGLLVILNRFYTSVPVGVKPQGDIGLN